MFFMFFPSQVPPSGPLQMYLPHQGRLIHGFPQNLAASVYYSISAASFLLFFSVPSFLTVRFVRRKDAISRDDFQKNRCHFKSSGRKGVGSHYWRTTKGEKYRLPTPAKKLLTDALLLTGLRVRRDVARRIFQGVRVMEESDTCRMILDEGREKECRENILAFGEERLGSPEEVVCATGQHYGPGAPAPDGSSSCQGRQLAGDPPDPMNLLHSA